MHVTNLETEACFPRVFIAFAGEDVNVFARETLACEVSHKIPELARFRDIFEEGQVLFQGNRLKIRVTNGRRAESVVIL